MQKGKGHLLVERSLGVAGSRLSSRLGQRFMAKGLYVFLQSSISLSYDFKLLACLFPINLLFVWASGVSSE